MRIDSPSPQCSILWVSLSSLSNSDVFILCLKQKLGQTEINMNMRYKPEQMVLPNCIYISVNLLTVHKASVPGGVGPDCHRMVFDDKF